MKETILIVADLLGMAIILALIGAIIYFAGGCGSIDPAPTPIPAPSEITCEQVCRHASDELVCLDYVDQVDGTKCQDWLCNMAGMPGIAARWECIMGSSSCDEIAECP